MNRWKRGYPKLVSHIKPWSQQNPILFLNIQASSKIVWFEMLRANHRIVRILARFAFTKSKSKSIHRFQFCYSLLQDDHGHKMVCFGNYWYGNCCAPKSSMQHSLKSAHYTFKHCTKIFQCFKEGRMMWFCMRGSQTCVIKYCIK